MATNPILDPKLPGEKVFIDLDFSNLFDSGVTITSVSMTAQRYSGGADPDPGSLLQGTGSHVGMVCSELAIGGVAGVEYLIVCAATGSDGSINVIEVVLPVVDVRLG